MKLRIGTKEECEEKLKSGIWQQHDFNIGALITEIIEIEGEKLLVVQILAGERFDDWIDQATEHLVVFGRKHGCVAIEATCRLGLEKKLKPRGFKRTRILLRKEI